MPNTVLSNRQTGKLNFDTNYTGTTRQRSFNELARPVNREKISNMLQERKGRSIAAQAAPHRDMSYTDTELISRLRVIRYCLRI